MDSKTTTTYVDRPVWEEGDWLEQAPAEAVEPRLTLEAMADDARKLADLIEARMVQNGK
jgi:hypothetical protein